MKPGNGEHPPRDPRQLDGLDTYPVAQVEAFVERIDELEAENKDLRKRVAELESDNKAMRAAGDALARHVAEDARGQTARRLVEAWAEVSR